MWCDCRHESCDHAVCLASSGTPELMGSQISKHHLCLDSSAINLLAKGKTGHCSSAACRPNQPLLLPSSGSTTRTLTVSCTNWIYMVKDCFAPLCSFSFPCFSPTPLSLVGGYWFGSFAYTTSGIALSNIDKKLMLLALFKTLNLEFTKYFGSVKESTGN